MMKLPHPRGDWCDRIVHLGYATAGLNGPRLLKRPNRRHSMGRIKVMETMQGRTRLKGVRSVIETVR